MQMGNIEHAFGDIIDPVVYADLAARGTEAGLAGERDAMLILAAGTDPFCVAALRVTAEHHALNDVLDVCLRIEGDLVGQAEVAVTLPVVEEYLAKVVVPGRVIERLLGRARLILTEWWVFDGEVSGCCVTGKNVQLLPR